MTRSDAVLDGRIGPAVGACVALAALLAGLVYWMLRPPPPAAPVRANAATTDVTSPVARARLAPPAPVQAPAAAAAPRPEARATHQPPDLPYRFIGKTTTGGETSIVLFGRGRTVTLRGPGPLDDEYVVDAVFDDYLVVRHVPTSVGKFLRFEQRRPAAGPSQDPEDSPRD